MDWVQAVTQMGFPIVACVGMAYFFKYMFDQMVKQNEQNQEALQNQTNTHSAEMKEVSNAINNNTQALIALKEKMEKEK